MKKILLVACVITSLIACNSNDTATEVKAIDSSAGKTNPVITSADGFTSLFDGVSTAGWHRYGGGVPGSSWKVVDGVLVLDSAAKMDGGNLVSNEEYENLREFFNLIVNKQNEQIVFKKKK